MSPRIVTRDIFAEFIRDEDMREDLVADEVLRFERNKKASGVLSELMIPLLFQEYVIGYVYLVNTQPGRPPFDLPVLETFHQFAKVLAYSLKVNGYFRNSPKKARDFSADVIDISAGGLLFSNTSRELSTSLLPGSEMELSIKAKGRTVKALATVKRVFRDATRSYFGMEYAELRARGFPLPLRVPLRPRLHRRGRGGSRGPRPQAQAKIDRERYGRMALIARPLRGLFLGLFATFTLFGTSMTIVGAALPEDPRRLPLELRLRGGGDRRERGGLLPREPRLRQGPRAHRLKATVLVGPRALRHRPGLLRLDSLVHRSISCSTSSSARARASSSPR